LLEEVMPFWEARTRDTEAGGYLTCFDGEGNLADGDKYIWYQGRQLWMFSALYNQVERRQGWLDLARHGRDFLVAHAHAGNGRWHYHLDRAGTQVKKGTISIYTDMFVLAGLCEYALASRSDQDLDLIRQTYDAAERNIHDPQCKDIFHGTWSPLFKRHGTYMMGLTTAGSVQPVLGVARTRPLIDHCLHEILHVFAKDQPKALFESVGRQGGEIIDDDEGRVLNPGHCLESMWFAMEEGHKRRDRRIIDRAVQITDWMYRRGYDKQNGGIVAFLDASGREPRQMDWHRETGMAWHDKTWWVHSEALYALALAAVESESPQRMGWFLDLHEWCQKHFRNPATGEWRADLHRDGRPKTGGTSFMWKAAYHLPRAMMKIMQLLEQC
jgi:N-acylglucosamine 2-epimerase